MIHSLSELCLSTLEEELIEASYYNEVDDFRNIHYPALWYEQSGDISFSYIKKLRSNL